MITMLRALKEKKSGSLLQLPSGGELPNSYIKFGPFHE